MSLTEDSESNEQSETHFRRSAKKRTLEEVDEEEGEVTESKKVATGNGGEKKDDPKTEEKSGS